MIKLILLSFLTFAELHVDFVKDYIIITKDGEIHVVRVDVNKTPEEIVKQVCKEIRCERR